MPKTHLNYLTPKGNPCSKNTRVTKLTGAYYPEHSDRNRTQFEE